MEQNNNTGFYQTGNTTPPKSHRSVIAALLIVVIFLVGVVTALSLMNVHLFKLLEDARQSGSAVHFSRGDGVSVVSQDQCRSTPFSSLGFEGQDMGGVFGQYSDLPDGVYICTVYPNTPVQQAGLQPGDIITQFNDIAVTGQDILVQLVQDLPQNQPVCLTVFRDGEYLVFQLSQ